MDHPYISDNSDGMKSEGYRLWNRKLKFLLNIFQAFSGLGSIAFNLEFLTA
jgi:hypothetical protein